MKIFNVILIIVCFFHSKGSGEVFEEFHFSLNIKNQIALIPEDERIVLENFFQILISSESLGYVLFGSKPICLSGYFLKLPPGNMLRRSNNSLVKKGWELWKKYEYLFPHPNYLIFAEDNIRGDKNNNAIFFVNKVNLLKVVTNNIAIFSNILGSNFNSDGFLIKISERQSISELTNFHEGLLGIMLGYGAESSMLYYKRDLINRAHPQRIHEKNNLKGVPQAFLYTKIYPIQFVGNPASQEVNAILEQNAKERSYLLELYSQGRWLEITLNKLTSVNTECES